MADLLLKAVEKDLRTAAQAERLMVRWDSEKHGKIKGGGEITPLPRVTDEMARRFWKDWWPHEVR